MNAIKINLGQVNNSCFVVMPFTALFQTEYEEIIKPALFELSIDCIRGDEIYTKQRIIDDIWNYIRKCRFVLAELTDKNPNVLYEIGLAHAIGKPVIIITRNSDDVPFDLKALRYLYYNVNDPFWGSNLKLGIQNLAKKIIENQNIDNCLDGILSDTIEYPKLPDKPVKQRQAVMPSFDITGTWIGEFTDPLQVNHKITLELNQKNDSLFGAAVISYLHANDKQTVVQEMMNGSIKQNNIELHGVNYTYIERGPSTCYVLDNYILQFDKRTNILKGENTYSLVDKTAVKAKIQFKKLTAR